MSNIIIDIAFTYATGGHLSSLPPDASSTQWPATDPMNPALTDDDRHAMYDTNITPTRLNELFDKLDEVCSLLNASRIGHCSQTNPSYIILNRARRDQAGFSTSMSATGYPPQRRRLPPTGGRYPTQRHTSTARSQGTKESSTTLNRSV